MREERMNIPRNTILKSNESLHITVMEPPKKIRSLGIFSNIPDQSLVPIVEQFLTQAGEEKTEEFLSNVKEEVIKLLMTKTVLTVSINDQGIYTVKLR